MLFEVALLQRHFVFPDHPVYVVGILPFSIVANTGAGSLLIEYLPLGGKPWIFLYVIYRRFDCTSMPAMKYAVPPLFFR